MQTTEAKTNQHSPGPWRYHKCECCDTHGVVGDDGNTVAEVHAVSPETRENMPVQVNARLIASAPNLLRVAKEILEFLENGTPVREGSLIHLALHAVVANAEAK
jgi:hypothetical protein